MLTGARSSVTRSSARRTLTGMGSCCSACAGGLGDGDAASAPAKPTFVAKITPLLVLAGMGVLVIQMVKWSE